MEITISSDVFGLSSAKHLHRNAVLHPGNDVVMMWWLSHLISQWGIGLNTSDLTQQSGLITRIASDLCWAHQQYPYIIRSKIGLWHVVSVRCGWGRQLGRGKRHHVIDKVIMMSKFSASWLIIRDWLKQMREFVLVSLVVCCGCMFAEDVAGVWACRCASVCPLQMIVLLPL